jgi:hypothetical protein
VRVPSLFCAVGAQQRIDFIMSEKYSKASAPTTAAPGSQPGEGDEGPRITGKGWTLGNSNGLVEGAAREPAWVSIAWLVVPMVLALVTVFVMSQM